MLNLDLSVALIFFCYCLNLFGYVIVSKFSDDLFCPVNDHVRNSGEFGYLDTVALVGSALYDLTQKDNVVAVFFYRNAVVVDVIHLAFKLSKFMVVSCKQGFGTKDLSV